MARQAMSMEAMLDEERREVLALLEGRSSSRSRGPGSVSARSPSPYAGARSPVRSMLDFGDEPSPSPGPSSSKSPPRAAAPVRSMLDFGPSPPPAPSPQPQFRSMLDVDSPPASATKPVFSNPTSPIELSPRAHSISGPSHPRSLSDAAVKPAEFGPRASISHLDPTAGYQFSGIITNNAGQAMPKRVTQGGKRNVMAEIMRGSDVGGLVLPGERGRHYSVGGPSPSHGVTGGSAGRTGKGGNKSKSPHNRLGVRSNSPGNLLSGRRLSPAGRAILDDGQTLDMSNAYRRLSDANLARSGGSLSVLSRRKRSDDAASSGRLAKDYLSPDGDILPEDSSEDDEGSSSEDEGERGRRQARSFEKSAGADDGGLKGPGLEPKERKTSRSLLAAAEEERLEVAASQPAYHYRSLLDEPQITVTNPSGEKAKHKPGIHPATSFDNPGSGTRTPIDSDTEQDFTDIKRAQRLSFAMTPIIYTSESHRAIRIIYRGEYARVVQDAEQEHRRLKKYLVATDLSEESTHALEWTVGTVLRDGDTLIALYCVDEETGITGGEGIQVPDEPKAMKEQAAAINAVTNNKTAVGLGGSLGNGSGGGGGSSAGSSAYNMLHPHPGIQRSSPLARAVDLSGSPWFGGSATTAASGDHTPSLLGISPAPSSRERTKAEEERERAIVDITDRVTKLLRKTRLQVRVLVEVLHCKNPKHLITEVIDLVNPTLVILGSRGRSALKGVILGSFSNYLVTKSSVPVMVARKRLRKQSKYKRTTVPQVNNLTNPTARSLATAKID